jgi:hypothetical protein
MSTPERINALRRANPRNEAGFAESVETAEGLVRHVVASAGDLGAPRRSRRRLLGVSAAAAALVAVAAVIAYSTIGSSGVPSAAAAVRKAGNVTAASAERSGTVSVRMTLDGRAWAGTTVQWNGADVVISRDVSISSDIPQRKGPGSPLLVVDGLVYVVDGGRWLEMGSPKNIDPESGTTPGEYLSAARDDVGGTTLRRITNGMTGLSTRTLADGSTVYSGDVPAGLIARETGFKEGQAIRVFPFGYVAHDEAANPAALLDASVTVGADGVVREILITWGTWTYEVTYSKLGSTAAPLAPANAVPLREWRKLGRLTR